MAKKRSSLSRASLLRGGSLWLPFVPSSILSPFLSLSGLFLFLTCLPTVAHAAFGDVVVKRDTNGVVWEVRRHHVGRSEPPVNSAIYENSLEADPGGGEMDSQRRYKPLGDRIPIILIHQYNRCGFEPQEGDWKNFVESFYKDTEHDPPLKDRFKLYRMKWHSNDLSVFDLGGELRDFLDKLDDTDDAEFRDKPKL